MTIVQLRNVGFVNKGAELMLHTVVRRFAERHPRIRPCIHYSIGTAAQRRKLGLLDVVWIEHHRIPGVRPLANAFAVYSASRGSVPARLREDHTVSHERNPGSFMRKVNSLKQARADTSVLGSQVDVVLDMSGFAYGDAWSPKAAEVATSYYRRVGERGGKVVLMPQQLGPFERPEARVAFRRLSAHCNLIYARDRASFEAASPVVEDPAVLRLAPDFTILQQGRRIQANANEGSACVIPNFKMLTETTEDARKAYPEFLRRCVQALRQREVPCFVLVHEFSGRDHQIARELNDAVGGIEIVTEADPLRIKGIIGASFITIGSRFHGLVSALSQAVPSLATSWSHKYEFLLEDYACQEFLLSPTCSDSELSEALSRIVECPSRQAVKANLQQRNALLVQRVEAMWSEIDDLIETMGPE
jgi:polysaccharide pyruvyl transferase WcaK-like protein